MSENTDLYQKYDRVHKNCVTQSNRLRGVATVLNNLILSVIAEPSNTKQCAVCGNKIAGKEIEEIVQSHSSVCAIRAAIESLQQAVLLIKKNILKADDMAYMAQIMADTVERLSIDDPKCVIKDDDIMSIVIALFHEVALS